MVALQWEQVEVLKLLFYSDYFKFWFICILHLFSRQRDLARHETLRELSTANQKYLFTNVIFM